MVRTAASALALVAALALMGYGWYRAATADPIGSVEWIAWRDHTGAPLPEDRLAGPGCRFSTDVHFDALVRGERLLVPCRTSYGVVDLMRGVGTMLPVPLELSRRWSVAVVPGPSDQVALVWEGGKPDSYDDRATVVAIAGPVSWRIAPQKIGRSSILATGWVDGAFELVQHVHTDKRGGDLEVIATRVTAGGVVRRTLPACELCNTIAVFHGGDRGWVQVVIQPEPPTYKEIVTRLVPERGAVVDLKPGPRMPDLVKLGRLDGLSSGVLSSRGFDDIQVLGRDGYLHETSIPPPPPGFRLLGTDRLRVTGDAVERHWVWVSDQDGTWAQRLGARSLFVRVSGSYGEISVGDDPQRLRPVTRGCDELATGIWMEARGGLALVARDGGCYAVFDPQLRPHHQRSLHDHLQTHGSRSRDVSTPEAVWQLRVVLFGLFPCLLAAAAAAALLRRRLFPMFAVGAAVYVVAALYALRKVWPLLS
jgi:hypothetical protein